MNGSASTQHGGQDSPEEPGQEESEPRFPWQVMLATAAWVVLGVLSVVTAVGAGGGSSGGADQASVAQISGSLGSSAVGGSQNAGHPVLTLILGLAVLLFALLLMLGQGWARWVLLVLGIVAVIMFAMGGRWETLVAMAVLVVGTVPLLSRSATRYLAAG